MENKDKTPSYKIGVTGFLGVALIALKLIDIINWPWVWVLAPIWLPNLIIIISLMLVAIFKQGRR
jgi:fatty acid desaturase